MTSTEDLRRSRGTKLKKFFAGSSKSSKSKTIRKDSVLGSTASVQVATGDRRGKSQIPAELSLEEILTKDGSGSTYLRVYCERVRHGDHFKTIKVYGNSSAQRCVNDLVKSYYTSLGGPENFQLFEVFGSIAPLENSGQQTVLTFAEVKSRPIPPDETLHTVFSSTSPGHGLARRIELRPVVPSPVRSPFSPQPKVGRSFDASLRESTSPFKRRSNVRGSLTLRDSRRHRFPTQGGSPDGPHLIQMRGQNPLKDILLYDLSMLIKKDGNLKEITIGSSHSAHIRLYSPPGENDDKPAIFAKLVGYDQPITVNGSEILSGAIYLEPTTTERNSSDTLVSNSSPPVYINDELLTKTSSTFFEHRLLRPGDFVCFGSNKRGYLFLFKDPRWIPDHRLELALPISPVDTPADTMSPVTPRRSIQIQREMANSDKSSDTDSSFVHHNSRLRTRLSVTTAEKLPRSACLRFVISSLFTHPSAISTLTTDPFSSPPWSKIEPWRSAGLFAHLIRTTAGFIVHPNPSVPNKDVETKSVSTIHNYATNHIKDMHALLFECHQNLVTEGETLIYPHLWLSLFCYDLAVLLSPGWLERQQTSDIGRPPRHSRFKRNDIQVNDGNESSGSSNASTTASQAIEVLPIIVELRELAYRLADDSIRNVMKITFEEISPYIVSFYQDESSSAASGRSKESGFFSARASFSQYLGLQERLSKLSKCFNFAFHPSGTEELERRSSTASSPFHTTSTDSSTQSTRLTNNQGSYTNRIRHLAKVEGKDGSDQSVSTGTDSEGGEHWGARDYVKSKNSFTKTDLTRNLATGTENRIVAIVWRQLMASLAHNILHAILSTASIPVDSGTGERLLSCVTWLQQWLTTNKLDAHRRPLNILVEFASLLATPKDHLLKMNWTAMRSLFPEVQPSLLKFVLDEYLIEPELKPIEAWHVDLRDETAANEDPFEVIGLILDGWRSKECVHYQKISQRAVPTYRPRNPAELFKLNGTEALVQQLDKRLEEQSIFFRWSDLLKHYPPMSSVIQPSSEPEGIIVNRPESSQRTPTSRRFSSSAGKRNITSPVIKAVKNTVGVTQNPSSLTPFKPGSQLGASVTGTEFNDFMRPAPSSNEPQRILRNFGTDALQSSRELPVADQDTALYHLNQLITSLTSSGLQQLKQNAFRPATAVDQQYRTLNMNGRRQRNTLYESQPDLHSLYHPPDEHLSIRRTDLSRGFTPGLHEFRPEFPQNGREAEETLSTKRSYQSLWHISSDGQDDIRTIPADSQYSRNLLNLSRDFGKFRQTALSKGLDMLRSPMSETPTLSRRNPMVGAVGRSLGNLSLLHQSGQKPNIIIEETRDTSSQSEADSLLLRRDDDLSDVVSRTAQGNSIINVTLNKTPASGFGLKLEDGQRTALDQPGVFVKEITPNSSAENSGSISFGDRILAINGNDLTGMTYSESLKMLRECKSQATFTIQKCYLGDPRLLLLRKDSLPNRR